MSKAIVIYYSRTGNTKKMAVRIAAALKESGLSADLKNVEEMAPAAVGKPDDRALHSCDQYAAKLAALTNRLFP